MAEDMVPEIAATNSTRRLIDQRNDWNRPRYPGSDNIGYRRDSMNTTGQFPATIRIGILVYEGFEPIDVWGFTEAFAISRFIGTGYQSPPPYPFQVLLISNEVRPAGKSKAVPAPVKSANGPRVAPDIFRDEAL